MKTQSDLGHLEGLVDLSPILPTTLEMKILFNVFLKETGYNPIRREDYVENFYGWYNGLEAKRKIWVENISSGADKYRKDYLHPRIRRKIKTITDGRFIVDFGCGTCESVLPNLKNNQHYLGIDTSRYCLEYASKKYDVPIFEDELASPNLENQRILLRFGALPCSIPFQRKRFFDEALASMVLHHVEDYKTAIKSIMGLLHPRANYFIVTFNSEVRKNIETGFQKISIKEETKTRGDFRLPKGLLKDETIYFHKNEEIHRTLQKYSSFIHSEECAGIFQIFEGIKK